MDIKSIFGQNVRKYRKAFGYTQMQFAEIIEVDQKHISFIESGNSFPSPNLISKIAENFNIKPKDLFDYDEPVNITELKNNINKMLENIDYEDVLKVHNYISILTLKKD
ncbi:helix-turn-helix transcriptional regulator [bacterium]|nr:helix-turn-helix transcriptional regulator [bacterium]